MGDIQYEQVLGEVVAIVRQHVDDPALVRPEARFDRDLGLESVLVLEIIEALEDRFDVTIPLNLLPEMETVAQAARRLTEIVAASGGSGAQADDRTER